MVSHEAVRYEVAEVRGRLNRVAPVQPTGATAPVAGVWRTSWPAPARAMGWVTGHQKERRGLTSRPRFD